MLTLTDVQNVTAPNAIYVADIFIAACGYEQRSTYLSKMLAAEANVKVAIGFTEQRVLDYCENNRWFTENGFEFYDVDDKSFQATFSRMFIALEELGRGIKVFVDISSFNRFRLAEIVDTLRSLKCERVDVRFGYSIATYTPPVEDSTPTVVVGPVTPQFAGWTTRPDRPPAAIVGLGYETNKAIGIVDHLEINNATWAYYPVGPIKDYFMSVRAANQSLLNIIQSDGRCQAYDLDDPAQLFLELNSLVQSLKSQFNVVLIPFGPKIFALLTLLVATLNEDVGVWRVSSGLLETPVCRVASEHVVAFDVTFRRLHLE